MSNLEYKKVKSIKRIKKKQRVYNFNVPGYENYVANGFVVHNCENHKLSQSKKIEGKYFSPIDIVNTAKEKHCESVSMSYNEPIISYEYLIDVAEECRKNDLKFIIKTNAYVNFQPWEEICNVVDAINIDWKGSERSFKAITGAAAYILRARIREAYNAGIHIEISIPLYCQDDELEEEMKILGEFLSSVDKDIPCHLLRISSSYEFENFVFNTDNLERAKNVLSNYMSVIHTVV